MGIISFVKKWTLPTAMVTGAATYALFAGVECLRPVGEAAEPYIMQALPVLIFMMFYVTFCKMRVVELRPRAWHFWLQAILVALAAVAVLAVNLVADEGVKLLLEGVFICIICPTATAAPIVTEKLGGSLPSLTVFALTANTVASVAIPVFFPLVEKDADIGFAIAFMTIFKRLIVVLVVPLCLAQLTRRYAPSFTERLARHKNIAFYMWAFNLAIVMGMTVKNIATATVGGTTLALLIVLPAGVCLMLFAIGKAVGRQYSKHHPSPTDAPTDSANNSFASSTSISAGQAMGQKNTIVGIWLTVNFLNPTAAIAPCAYVIWQNVVNSWQLWYKQKYGRLKW